MATLKNLKDVGRAVASIYEVNSVDELVERNGD